MPHIDELLGAATIAAAGLFAAISVQPAAGGAAGNAVVRNADPVSVATTRPVGREIARLPSIEVQARRSVELARIEREDRQARDRAAGRLKPSSDAPRIHLIVLARPQD